MQEKSTEHELIIDDDYRKSKENEKRRYFHPLNQETNFTMVIEMTKKSLGHVAVKNKANKLVGIITDGDLRRHIKKGFLTLNAKEIMSSKPMLICKEELVINILRKMNV